MLMEDWASTQAALDLRGMVVGEMVCVALQRGHPA